MSSILNSLYQCRESRNPRLPIRESRQPKPWESGSLGGGESLFPLGAPRRPPPTFGGGLDTRQITVWLADFVGWDTVPMSSVHAEAMAKGYSTREVDALIRESYIVMKVNLTGVTYIKRPKLPSWSCGP